MVAPFPVRPQTPELIFGLGVVKPKRRRKPIDRRKKKKKKKEREVLPTLTQQLVGIRRKAPIRRVTGFEIARI